MFFVLIKCTRRKQRTKFNIILILYEPKRTELVAFNGIPIQYPKYIVNTIELVHS